MTLNSKRVCVIAGAGMAGLTAAGVLHAKGWEVVLLDKGRGVGGRMATRRIGESRLDHGAQFSCWDTRRFPAGRWVRSSPDVPRRLQSAATPLQEAVWKAPFYPDSPRRRRSCARAASMFADCREPHWREFAAGYRSAASMALFSSGDSGATAEPKRAITFPFRSARNFVKFQRISPPVEGLAFLSVRNWYS